MENACDPVGKVGGVTLAMVTFVRLLEYWKALLPMEVTEAGMANDVNPENIKAESPIVVTEDGIIIVWRMP